MLHVSHVSLVLADYRSRPIFATRVRGQLVTRRSPAQGDFGARV